LTSGVDGGEGEHLNLVLRVSAGGETARRVARTELPFILIAIEGRITAIYLGLADDPY
jgi:hypothetical protein